MKGYTKITKSEYAVYVRFLSVGNRQRFELVMDKFNQAFPMKEWDENRRSWQLEHADLTRIIDFSKSLFGPTNYMIIDEDNMGSYPRQSTFI